MRYPSGRVVSYVHDGAGWVTEVTGYTSGIQYTAYGAVSQMTLGNGVVESVSYNNRLQPVAISAVKESAMLLSLKYGYGATNNNGNLLSQTIQPLGVLQEYGYDALNRGYGMDQYGNRWVATNTGLPLSPLTPVTQNWFEAGTNRLTAVGYDGSGNQTQVNPFTVAYDGESRQVSATQTIGGTPYTSTFAYDGEGRRVKKVLPDGKTTIYVYDALGQLAAEYSTANNPESGTQYVTADHLGSTRLVTDAAGAVVRRHDYLPYGEEMLAGTGGRTEAQKYRVADDGSGVRQKFTGKERDAETGLDYFGARYLSAAQGRFTTPDPLLGSANPLNPQSWNRYTYTLNNPLRYTDPFGLYEWDATLGGSATDDELRKQLSKKAASKIIDRRDDIRKAIAKGVGSKDADVSGAYQSDGAEGDAKGVTIASQRPTGGGVGAAGQQLEYVGGSFRSKATVSVDPNQSGNDLFITLGHEGSHVRDGQAYAAAAGRLDDVPALGPFNLSVLQTEMNAYSTSVNAARRLGLPNLNYSAGSQTYQIWRGGTAAVDRPVLEQFLRASPLYAPKLNNLMFPR